MRIELSNSNLTIKLFPESYHEATQLKDFFAAAGAKTTVAITQDADTARAGAAVAAVPALWKATQLATS